MATERARKRHTRLRWPLIAAITGAALVLLFAVVGFSPKFLPTSHGSSVASSESGTAGSHPGLDTGALPAKHDPGASPRPPGGASSGPSPGASAKGQTPGVGNTGGGSGSGGTTSGSGGSGSSGSPPGGGLDPCMVGTWDVGGLTINIGGSWYDADNNGVGFGVTSDNFTRTINANGSFTDHYLALSLTYSNVNPGTGPPLTISGVLTGSLTTTADAVGPTGKSGLEVASYTSGEVTVNNGSNVDDAITGTASYWCNGNTMWEDFSGENELMTKAS